MEKARKYYNGTKFKVFGYFWNFKDNDYFRINNKIVHLGYEDFNKNLLHNISKNDIFIYSTQEV